MKSACGGCTCCTAPHANRMCAVCVVSQISLLVNNHYCMRMPFIDLGMEVFMSVNHDQ